MRLPEPTDPFVFLDDARPGRGAPSRLYRDAVEIVSATALRDVQPALDRIADAVGQGLHAAGYIAYEAGFALEDRLCPLGPAAPMPLLWFGLFDGCRLVEPGEIDSLLPEPAGAGVSAVRPLIDYAAYASAFDEVQSRIRAGDIYQANLTFPCAVDLHGDPRALYAALRPRAAAGYGGIVHTGPDWLLSFSPELFFTLVRGQLTARPMKGTAKRLADPDRDAAAAGGLSSDPKQRAENLMIVDLLRNDLSRVSSAGSVTVPDLFHVESYPTVHQMISTVRSRLLPGLGAMDVMRTIFPCGSVTGAPKMQAMEVLNAVEAGPRGPYTGAIGRFDPDGNAAFNVAIRTLCVKEGSSEGRFGIGSGVIADSKVEAEWRECLDKARFLGGEIREAHTFEGAEG